MYSNIKFFLSYLENLSKENYSHEYLVNFLQFYASSMCLNYSEKFVSKDLEKLLVDISEDLMKPGEPSRNFKPKSILHVATEVYSVGGHTRLMLNFIKAFPDYDHKIFLSNQRSAVPEFFENFEIYESQNETLLSKAITLEQMASNYEFIVLYHHPYDILPLLAFGSSKFNRKTFLYNHADHMWGCGYSISNYIIEPYKRAINITAHYRGVNQDRIIYGGIPLEFDDVSLFSSKKRYQIVTMASSYKFISNEELSFFHIMDLVLSSEPKAIWHIIGVSNGENDDWINIKTKYNERVILHGILEKDDAQKILQSSWVYVDSFPFGSMTSMLEGLSQGLPAFGCTSIYLSTDQLKTELPSEYHITIDKILACLNMDVNNYMKLAEALMDETRHKHSLSLFRATIEKYFNLNKNNKIIIQNLTYDRQDCKKHCEFTARVLGQHQFRFDYEHANKLSKYHLKTIAIELAKLDLLNNTIAVGWGLEWLSLLIEEKNYFCQLFIDIGDGYCEKDSIVNHLEFKQIYSIRFDLVNYTNIKSIRLDPLNDCCHIKINNIELTGNNNLKINLLNYVNKTNAAIVNNDFYFGSSDPNIYFNIDENLLSGAKCIMFQYELFDIGKSASCTALKHLNIEDKLQTFENKVSSSNSIKHGLLYNIKKFLKTHRLINT
jgi:hypothetical protein